MGDVTLWSGTVQAGFAAFALALLAFCAWLVRNILALSKSTQEVVRANTEAITKQIVCLEEIAKSSEGTRRDVERLRFLLEARPCLVPGRDNEKPPRAMP